MTATPVLCSQESGVEPVAASRGALYHPRAWSAVLPREQAAQFFEDPAVQKLMATLV